LRLLALAGTAEAFNNDRSDTSPYREWIKAHSEEVIPNDFAGGYNVRSELFWNLETKYHTLRIAERIAWAAVENPQPHDCEGDEVCHYLPLEPLLNICEGTRMARMLLKPSRSLTSCLRMTSSNSQTGKKPTRTWLRIGLTYESWYPRSGLHLRNHQRPEKRNFLRSWIE